MTDSQRHHLQNADQWDNWVIKKARRPFPGRLGRISRHSVTAEASAAEYIVCLPPLVFKLSEHLS
jgi:hypothetical protein